MTDAPSGNVFYSVWDDFDVASVAFDAGALGGNNPFDLNEISKSEISIFPNPSKDYINISIHHATNHSHTHRHMPLNDGEIEIYNNLGRVVYNNNINIAAGTNNLRIETSNLLAGQYYVNVIIDGENNLNPLTIIK